MLASCPNLVSVTFDLPISNIPYNPNLLAYSLCEQVTFPHLRTFRFRGSARPNWAAFFNNSESSPHPLQSFIIRHPKIEDLGLGSCIGDELPDNIDPNDMPRLFPSIKCFEGPVFLCNAIVQSTLAGQLESLVLADETVYSYGNTLKDVTLGVGTLPRLHKLAIWAKYPIASLEDQMRLEVQILKRFFEAAGALEELEIRTGVDDHVRDCILLHAHF